MSAPSAAGRSAERVARRVRRGVRMRRVVAMGVAGAAATQGWWPVVAVACVVAVWPDRRSRRWAAGAAGERRTAEALAGVEDEGWTVRHDVRLPGRSWNLDHVLDGPAGLVVVESKQWRADRPVRVVRRRPRIVEERVGWQVDALAATLRDDRPVHGYLCIHGAPVRRWRLMGARWAPVGDADHLRRWLRRL